MQNSTQWYVMRVTYGREMKFKQYLDTVNIDSFIPMKYKEVIRPNGGKERILVPAVGNLIFVKSSREVLDPLKHFLEGSIPARYMMDRATQSPMVVPDKEMTNFIAVAGTCHEQLIYLDHIAPSLNKGERVRITGGIFAGVEGRVVRIKKDRRVMVSINGLVAVATTFIHPSMLEKLKFNL